MLNHIHGRYKLYSEQEPLGSVNRFALPLNLHLILQTLSRDVPTASIHLFLYLLTVELLRNCDKKISACKVPVLNCLTISVTEPLTDDMAKMSYTKYN